MEKKEIDTLRIDPKSFSIKQALLEISTGDLHVSPRTWSFEKRDKLIETVLMRIPLPTIYLASDGNGTLTSIVGGEMLHWLHSFAHNEFRFASSALNMFTAVSFSELEPLMQRRFNHTQLTVHVIDPQTSPSMLEFAVERILSNLA